MDRAFLAFFSLFRFYTHLAASIVSMPLCIIFLLSPFVSLSKVYELHFAAKVHRLSNQRGLL
jgi:hypothetical protein